VRPIVIIAAATLLLSSIMGGFFAPSASGGTARSTCADTVAIGFIGDSITYGEFTTTPAPSLVAADFDTRGLTVLADNQGHSGAKSADWAPGARSGYLATAKASFATSGVHIVHIMLGTNDAAQRIPTAAYHANMVLLLNDLIASGYTPVLTAPIASVNSRTNLLLRDEAHELTGMVNGATTLRGDERGYDYFFSHQEQLVGAGLHPDDLGTAVMARYWATALWPLAQAAYAAQQQTMQNTPSKWDTCRSGLSGPWTARGCPHPSGCQVTANVARGQGNGKP